MNHKNRLAKLEEQRTKKGAAPLDTLKIRKVNYRSGIIAGVNEDPADAIPLRIVKVNHESKE